MYAQWNNPDNTVPDDAPEPDSDTPKNISKIEIFEGAVNMHVGYTYEVVKDNETTMEEYSIYIVIKDSSGNVVANKMFHPVGYGNYY